MRGVHLKHRIATCLVAACCSTFAAQAAAPESPYVGQESRGIKALSLQTLGLTLDQLKALSPEDVDAYLAGKGMGLAKAAELNGYPGPAHVLELASQLSLTSDQRARTQALFASMQAKATGLGRTLVERERELDRLFADKTITPERLAKALTEIGSLQAQVRGAHLEAHLAQVAILTPEQNIHYAELRGYSGAGTQPSHTGQHQH